MYSTQSTPLQGGSSSCLMVYDYVEHDLMGLIRRKVKFSAAQIKYILKEILEAVETLHSEHIEHGHLKSIVLFTLASNIYLNTQGCIKIDAFVPPSGAFPTSSYSSVEKILGIGFNSSPLASDLFSIGLIFLEIVLEECIFDCSKSPMQHIEQLLSIFGPSIITPFERQLKSCGLWPQQQLIVKASRGSLGQFLFKRAPK